MKKAALIAIVGLMFSCSYQKPKYEKPFIVVYSYPSNSQSTVNTRSYYEAQDKNGKIIEFCDANYKYSVGDTLN